jgi:hypothetical protein
MTVKNIATVFTIAEFKKYVVVVVTCTIAF